MFCVMEKFLCCVLLQGLLMVIHLSSNCQGYTPYLSRDPPKECRAPAFSGRTRTKQRGRMLKYQCNWGYELVGQRYATCVNGKWDSLIPICIRAGCPKIVSPTNGLHVYTRRNAAAMFFCNPGFAMVGNPTLYCNGTVWNGTAPLCASNTNVNPAMSCDFEDAAMCGWTHDPYHDFDWRRQNGNTPSGHIGTGPSYDHTLGSGKDGYYMYIESTSRVENDTARLISPVYPASLSRSGCFSFYYHMYGRTTGQLSVLVHPASLELSSILADDDLRRKYTLFKESGNQGNMWFHGFFDLDVMQDNFQIVLEGVRGPGYVSDIAVDDVSILQEERCVQEREQHTASTDYPITVKDSCLNRCDQKDNSTRSGENMDCYCSEDCDDLGSCCVDYKDLCVFSLTDSPGDTNDSTTDSSGTTDVNAQPPPPLPPSLKQTATNYPHGDDDKITYSAEKFDPVTVRTTIKQTQPTTSSTTTARPTTAKQTTKITKLTSTLPPRTTPETTVVTTLKTTLPTTQKTIKTTQKVVVKATSASILITTKLGVKNVAFQNVPIQTDLRSKPVLQILTPYPPYKNATGVLKKAIDEVELMPEVVNRMKDLFPKSEDKIKNNTVADKTLINKDKVTTESANSVKYSKTYDHYSKNYPKTNESSTLNSKYVYKLIRATAATFEVTEHDQSTSSKFLIKSERMTSYNDDAHIANPEGTSSSTGLVVLLSLLVVCFAAGAVFLIRSGLLKRLVHKGRRIRLEGGSSSNSDMKYLVQDEELEHDYEDL